MDNLGLVSIIMPTFNSARFIKETIDSVLAQTYKNWEIIAVDNDSTDETQKIIESYKDTRIFFYLNNCNKGQAFSRNRAIQLARGRFIAFLDSDDIWFPDKLEKQLSFMSKHGYKACYSNYIEIDQGGKELGVMYTGPEKMTAKFYDTHYGYIGFLTSIFDASLVGKVFANDKIGSACADQALLYRVMEKGGEFHLLDEVLAKYRIVNGSPSHSGKFRSLKYHYIYYRLDRKLPVVQSLFQTFRKGVFYIFGKKVKFRKKYNGRWKEN